MPSTTEECPAATTPTFGVRIRPARGFDRAHGAERIPADGRHLAVLEDIDAERIGRARIAPGDGIMTGNAAPPLQGPTQDGIAQGCRRFRSAGRTP